MEQEPRRMQPSEASGYYGTGRRPKQRRSLVPLAAVLAVTVLAVNGLTVAIRVGRSRPEKRTEPTVRESREPDAILPCAEQHKVRTTQLPGTVTAFDMEISVLEEEERRYWDLPEGVMIDTVVWDGHAHQAGVRQGDILQSINGIPIIDTESYHAAIRSCEGGQTASFVIYRCGEEIEAELILP